MSNATAHPLRSDRRAYLTATRSDEGREITIKIVGPVEFTDHEAEELAHELNVLGSSGRRAHLISILQGVNKALRLEEEPGHSSLTEAELDALRAAGSLVEPENALPVEERPSVLTALRQQDILAEALPTKRVAELLDVTEGRVRQRHGEGTLFAIPGPGRGLRFPTFQFTDHGELPGWGTVSRALPEGANPVAVEYFLTHAHPDLGDGELTPAQWLAAGKPAEPVAALAEQAFSIR
ncbi:MULTISPECIES: hypothetical protein [Microbacterium]|uniref:hypothetical protein n=1 Tax=Microbacterium TaxID=33882 RepID=UPI000B0510AB|nr:MULTISPECIES: hypothetical protein [Microbacterium]MCT1394454.1 hypothetical protein [Microbacterium sp. p3-SID338]QNA91781.1 hypothetical protein G4G29_03745 [Microbacterium sp. Se63.02b]QYM64981.1 hypothetical protein K1X59_03735 [Microbacterium sp. Se5.02b]